MCSSDLNVSIRGAQIDLLIDRNDDVIDVCEMKYYADEFVMDENEANRINNRILRLREETGTDKAIHVVLVTTKGLKRNAYSDIIQAEIGRASVGKECVRRCRSR